MKDNKIFKGSYIPFNTEEDDGVEIYNATFDYIRRFGIKLDNKGNRVLNPKHIIINNTQILVNRSFFKGDLLLLKTLEKLPKEITEHVFWKVFDVIGMLLGNKEYTDWDSMEYILIDDVDSLDDIKKTKQPRFIHKNGIGGRCKPPFYHRDIETK
jgi:hypothetical protein